MQINFETLFEQVPAAGLGDYAALNREQFAELITTIFASAKVQGISGYDILEAAFLKLGVPQDAETFDIIDPQTDRTDAEQIEFIKPDLGTAPVSEEEALARDGFSDPVASSFVEDVQTAFDAGELED